MSETVVGQGSARVCATGLGGAGGTLAELRIRRYTVGRSSLHGCTSRTRQTLMNRLTQIACAALAAVAIAACGIPTQTTTIADGPAPVTVRLEPATPTVGQDADLMVTSPHADSIAVESENGLDRYWTTRDTLRIQLDPNSFGDSLPTERYATRFDGELLSRAKRDALLAVAQHVGQVGGGVAGGDDPAGGDMAHLGELAYDCAGAVPCAYSWTVTPRYDGYYAVYARVRDTSGNEAEVVWKFTAD